MDAVPCTSADLTGPKTEDGLARLTAARTTHGKYTKEKRAAAAFCTAGPADAGGAG